MRKVVIDNEYNSDGDDEGGDGDDEGQDDNILEAPRCCPRDRRFTPLLGAEEVYYTRE